MTVEEYWQEVRTYLESNPSQRPGQAAMNVLREKRPDLYDQIYLNRNLNPWNDPRPLQELFSFAIWITQHWHL